MGKKSKEATQEPSGVFKSLFTADNPFRRKPQPDSQPLQQQLELGFVSGADGGGGGNPKDGRYRPDAGVSPAAEAKKRKKHDIDEAGTGPETSKKRKSVENGDVTGSPKKRRKKRKRDEIEEVYERSKYGAGEEEEEKGQEEEGGERRGLGVSVGEKRKEMDDGKEMMTERESFDDESKMLRTVFVGNLPLKTKRKALLKEFCQFGEVESVRIRSIPILDSKIPRKGAIIKGKVNDAVDSVHAYIVFKDEQSAQAALANNMAKIGGNHIRVDMACPPRKKLKGAAPLYNVKRTVFIGNLPFDVKDEELYQLFCEANKLESSIEGVRVVRDPNTSMGKGIAYVLFKTREAANVVVRRKDLKLRDRNLRLSHARTDTTPSKRKSPVSRPTDFPNKRLEIAPGQTPPSSCRSSSSSKPIKAGSLSYQGLRASKSGVQKKAPRAGQRAKFDGRASSRAKFDGRAKPGGATRRWGSEEQTAGGRSTTKRPAVAARKAKDLGVAAANKRKQVSGTPENSRRNKKARHFE